MEELPRPRARDRSIARAAGGPANDMTSNNKQDSFHLATWNVRDLGGINSTRSRDLARHSVHRGSHVGVRSGRGAGSQQGHDGFPEADGPSRSALDLHRHRPEREEERLAFVLTRARSSSVMWPARSCYPQRRERSRSSSTARLSCGVPGRLVQVQHLHRAHPVRRCGRHHRPQTGDRRYRQLLHQRQKKDGETYILLGDFNILNAADPTMAALLGGGFAVAPELRKPTALASANFYDQIALRTQDKLVEMKAPVRSPGRTMFSAKRTWPPISR